MKSLFTADHEGEKDSSDVGVEEEDVVRDV